MKKNIPLTAAQQQLVETNLEAVIWAIRDGIHPSESIPGLGYNDLYQEGCVWLCRAAQSFEPGRAQFATYAKKVIRNGLLSYCRAQCGRQSHLSPLSADEISDSAIAQLTMEPGEQETQLAETEILDLLRSHAAKYSGVARLGIEALSLKATGMSIAEIAALYDVPPSHVGAWISRGKQKLRQDEAFVSAIL